MRKEIRKNIQIRKNNRETYSVDENNKDIKNINNNKDTDNKNKSRKDKIIYKINRIKEIVKFWYSNGLNIKYLLVLIFGNLLLKGLEGIGLGLLIPLANGIISHNFSLMTNSKIFIWVGKLIPSISSLSNVGLFILLSAIIFSLNIVKSIITYFFNIYIDQKGLKITSKITGLLFEKQISFGKVFLDQTNAGEHASKVSMIPRRISMVMDNLQSIISGFIQIIVYIGILIFLSPIMSLSIVICLPIVILIVFVMKNKIKNLSSREVESDFNLSKIVYNSLLRLPMIKIYNNEKEEVKVFDSVCKDFEKNRMNMNRFRGLLKPIQDIVVFIMLFFIASTLGFLTYSFEGIKVANLLVFFIVFSNLLKAANSLGMPMFMFINNISLFNNLEKSYERLNDSLIKDGSRVFKGLKKSIEIKGLFFKYTKKMILKNMSCTIPKGKVTAIVGKTGSGKSTLINLLLRLYKVNENKIFFDGIDINDFTLKSLRKHFSYVSQDILLFDDTIYNNLVYGIKSKVSNKRMNSVLEKAQLGGLIDSLTDGLQTQIGDRGIRLSGGEKQRIALARALLHESSIIVFDEPTSSVDIFTEQEIQKFIEEATKDKTVIIISHSYHTIKNADHIIFIENGEVVEEGSQNQLISKKGLFYRLWRAQFSAPGERFDDALINPEIKTVLEDVYKNKYGAIIMPKGAVEINLRHMIKIDEEGNILKSTLQKKTKDKKWKIKE